LKTNIIRLTASDVTRFYPTFVDVLNTQFPGYSEKVKSYLLERIYNVQTLQYWIRRNEKIILIGENTETNSIVGFAVIDMPYGGVSFCRWLGILPEFQRVGIGKMLVNEWEKLAKLDKAHKMEVAGQPTAKGFYEKMGLNLEGFRKASYFGINQYLFGKVLSSPNVAAMVQ